MKETSGIIESLRIIGFTDTLILDLLLAAEGRISMEEWKNRFDAENRGDIE